MSHWNHKACLVTGGTAGLGKVLAATLVKRGARVVVNGRDADRLAQTVDELKQLGGEIVGDEIIGVAGDITEPGFARELVAKTIEAFGTLDFACHAAGRSMRGELTATSREDFESLWRVNTLAAFDMAVAVADALTAKRGHLVFIGSLASRVSPRYIGAYAESKFPLTAMAQQLRLERGPAGLHTLLVCPGPIARKDATPSDRYAAADQGLPDSATKPGGGAKVSAIDPEVLCEKILNACERRKAELIVPSKARLLFVLNQVSPSLGDWLLKKMTG
jgi:NAD(P)-dependent dehydrogenase (short-subunit alcohol dehydrogenase family)